MLNKLQSYIESEETKWQSQLRQKENEVANLRVELNDMQAKLISSEEVRIIEIFIFCNRDFLNEILRYIFSHIFFFFFYSLNRG